MIIGHGSLAKLLQDREGAILFAAGVGNSQCTNQREFMRERMMIRHCSLRTISTCFFYFSSIVKPLTKYGIHKEEMEVIVKNEFANYNIVRLGNIWECTNKNTFLNYLKGNPDAEIRENEIKYMIHADELNMICQALPLTGKHEISVFSDMLTVRQCLERKNPR